MMILVSLLLPIIASLIAQNEAITIKRENSLNGPYQEDPETLIFWDVKGDTEIKPTFIRLTPDEPEKSGGVWNNFPCMANNWEIQIHFKIHGKGVYLNGDGMAFWYVKDPMISGPVFGSKDHFSGLGVFIDSSQRDGHPHKHRHPYISAVVNNGSFSYTHDEDGTHGQVGGCHVPVRNADVPTKIAVSYLGNTLSVYLDAEGVNQWRPCFRVVGVTLPTGYHFGMTASTSDAFDIHDIISATTLNLDPPDKAWEDKSDLIPHAQHLEVPFKEGVSDEEEDSSKERGDTLEEEEEEEKEDVKEEKVQDKAQTQSETTTEEMSGPPTSLFRKFLYLSGGIIVLYITISMYRGWSERRRERMQKRLF